MQPERWTRIQALFAEALEQPPELREAFVREACAGDAGLFDEVASLLEAHEQEGPVDELSRRLALPPALAVGQRVGAYRLLEVLGVGGMGAVHLAERADGQYERQVALKLVRLAASPALQAQLYAERQILARLSHPHIAQLLDGGVTDDGQPYFAMEYVDGRPLDAYCEAHRLTIPERLRLFLDVCDAVAYAHQNLVIHRDLKPSNILVTTDGQVKLLDFGIARLLEEDALGTLMLPTRTGLRALTPAYASPEQVSSAPMTTASDVYSLGVVLYELLAGRRPYDVDGQSPGEIERIVCEVEPDKPSTALDRVPTVEVAATRPWQTEQWRRRLVGDLDVIVMKALRKEPAQRYASAHELRDDLQRYLDGLPIQARPPTLGYRAAKFIRRHRTSVAAAVLVLLSLLGGLTAAVWQARIAAAERDRARLEADKAAQVAAFLTGLFEESDPELNPASEKTARQLLVEGAARIERELRDQPVVQAQLMSVIGEVYEKLALYDEARMLLEGALERRTQHLAPSHPDRIASLRALAALDLAVGAYDAAQRSLDEALRLQRADPNIDPADLARTLDLYGNLHHEQEHYDEAEPLYREALALRQQALTPPHREIALSLGNLAVLLADRGRYDEAEPLYQETLAMDRAALGDLHPDVAVDLNNLGVLYYTLGRLDEAVPLMRESLAIRRQIYGEEHPSVARGLNNLASVLHDLGRLEEAEPLYREALALRRRAYGEEHAYVATSLGNLGSVLHDLGRLEEAEPLYREALAMRRRLFGEEHPSVAIQMNNVGRVLHDRGQLTEAEAMLRDALALSRRVHGNEHPYVGIRLKNLAGVLHDQQRYAEAGPLLDEALAVFRISLGEEHWQVAHTRAMRGDGLARQGQLAEAKPLLRAGYEGLLATRGADDPTTRTAASWLADLYETQGRTAEARQLRGPQMTNDE